MTQVRPRIALKEWAITVDALASGEQILLMRKGGIHEESKDFRIIHDEFLLYPTYEHQRPELLKQPYQGNLKTLLSTQRDATKVKFSEWATVHEVLEISEQDKIESLNDFHIWTDEYAQGRLHWKPMVPLSIILVRVYTLQSSTSVQFIPEYQGCTSWVDIIPKIDLENKTPVLSDTEFEVKVNEIKKALGR